MPLIACSLQQDVLPPQLRDMGCAGCEAQRTFSYSSNADAVYLLHPQALHVAAMRGHTPAVEVLLEAGLPAKTRSSRGWTAFDEACAARAMPVARWAGLNSSCCLVIVAVAVVGAHPKSQRVLVVKAAAWQRSVA